MLLTSTTIFVLITFCKNVCSDDSISSQVQTNLSTIQNINNTDVMKMNISEIRIISRTPLDDFPDDLFTGKKTTQSGI